MIKSELHRDGTCELAMEGEVFPLFVELANIVCQCVNDTIDKNKEAPRISWLYAISALCAGQYDLYIERIQKCFPDDIDEETVLEFADVLYDDMSKNCKSFEQGEKNFDA